MSTEQQKVLLGKVKSFVRARSMQEHWQVLSRSLQTFDATLTGRTVPQQCKLPWVQSTIHAAA